MTWTARARLLTERDTTLGVLMERLAEVHGDRRLVEEEGGATLDYHQAADRVARMAGGLSLAPGDRVVINLPNSYDLVLAALAVSRAGGVAVPVNAELTRAEVDAVAEDAGAVRIVRTADELLGGGAAPADAAPAEVGDVAAILYTSGTTGRPKGARLTHRALVGQVTSGLLWPAGLRRDLVVVSLPLAHIMGFAAVLGTAVAGLPVYFIPRFSPVRVLDALEQRRGTLFIGVPAMYRMMMEAGAEQRDLSSVRVWASGADAMPPDLARRFQRMGASATLPWLGTKVGEALFVEGYGMVETGGGVAFKLSPPGLSRLHVGSVGIPAPPNRMRVVREDGSTAAPGQVGELWVKGPGLLDSYHGDPDATSAIRTPDGWLRTGDMVRRGPFGLFQFAGRSKDVIKRGGYSVYALEVEKTLEEHPGVAEAAVVGLPDERLGEVPAAAVRPASGATLTEQDLAAWAADRLAEFKVPTRFLITDHLPRTQTRKVRRSEVREMFG